MAQNNRNGLHGENSGGFEQSFGRLQEVVRKLTEGNLALEDALSLFEEGMALAGRCTQMLDQAELRVQAVSARTSHAAAEALQGLEAAILSGTLEGDDGGIVSMSISSFESSLEFDSPGAEEAESSLPPRFSGGNLAYSPLPGEKRGGSGDSAPRTDTGKAPGAGPGPGARGNTSAGSKAAPEELDPLFDEDD